MAADPSIVDALGRTDLFSDVSKKVLRTIADQTKLVEHDAGKEITEEGGGATGFHLITHGKASVTVGGKARRTLGPGEYFGEISLIDGQPRSATVRSETPLRTISLSSWSFRPLLDEEPGVTKALLKVMCARLRAAELA